MRSIVAAVAEFVRGVGRINSSGAVVVVAAAVGVGRTSSSEAAAAAAGVAQTNSFEVVAAAAVAGEDFQRWMFEQGVDQGFHRIQAVAVAAAVVEASQR